jgi:hypothetical protein
MSATNFYQTLYQNDQLFRLADDSWGAVDNAADGVLLEEAPPLTPVTPVRTDDSFLAELEQLASPPAPLVRIDEPVDTPALVMPEAEAEPVVVVAVPEPLPQPAPRPTTPSILPPVQQQSRLPQLNHKVLLLADEELDPSNLLFLEKILKAVNLNINGVDLLNLHGVQGVDFAELLQGKYINHFITFGVPFERINLDIMMDRYAPVRFEGITFLMADSLPTIEADQN